MNHSAYHRCAAAASLKLGYYRRVLSAVVRFGRSQNDGAFGPPRRRFQRQIPSRPVVRNAFSDNRICETPCTENCKRAVPKRVTARPNGSGAAIVSTPTTVVIPLRLTSQIPASHRPFTDELDSHLSVSFAYCITRDPVFFTYNEAYIFVFWSLFSL